MSVHIHQAGDDPLVAGINDLGVTRHNDFRLAANLPYPVAFNDNEAVFGLPAGVYIDESRTLDDCCWQVFSALLVG